MQHVMVDLETMGNSSNCAIISIGAVQFDPRGSELGAEFYEIVSLESCQKAGLVIDPSTVMWWMQQSEEARAQFNRAGKVDLPVALDMFSVWFKGNGCVYLWGNGSDFDNVIMVNAYKACGIECPWKFWNHRCYRTLKSENKGVPMKRQGTYHSAIDDAKSQAVHLQEIYKSLRTPEKSWEF